MKKQIKLPCLTTIKDTPSNPPNHIFPLHCMSNSSSSPSYAYIILLNCFIITFAAKIELDTPETLEKPINQHILYDASKKIRGKNKRKNRRMNFFGFTGW